jgi:multiple sugar transport system substrate-binding protein
MTLDREHDESKTYPRKTFLKASAVAGATAGAVLGAGNVGRALAEAPALARASAGVAQIKFWDMLWGPSPQYTNTAKQLVDKFNASQSAIQVSYQLIPWTNWYQTFATAVASGSGPDISTGAGYQALQFSQKGAILPVDQVITDWQKDGEISDFSAQSLNLLKYQGHQVAIPWAIDIRVMYYRKDLFAQAGITKVPTTWPEFAAAAAKLTNKSKGIYGFGLQNSTGGSQVVLMFMLGNGGGLFDASGKPNLGGARNVEALDYLVTMAKNGSIDPAGAGWQDADILKAFGSGKLAMMVNNPGAQTNYPAKFLKNMGLMAPLKSPHGTFGTIDWVNNIMVYKETKNPEAAMTFLKWLSKNELPLFTTGGATQIPARKSLANQPFFSSYPFDAQIIKQYIPIAKSTATHDATLFPQLNAVEGQGFLQTMAQEVSLGHDPKSIISRASAQLEQVMQTA